MYEPIEIRQSELNTLVIQSVRYCLGRMTDGVLPTTMTPNGTVPFVKVGQ